MKDRLFTVTVCGLTVGACLLLTHPGVLGRHQLVTNHWPWRASFSSANALALRHTGENGAGAVAFQRGSDGAEMGAAGFKNDSGVPTYLNGAVYLAGGAYSPEGKPLPGGPAPVIIGQEGYFGAEHFNAARLKFAGDWSVSFCDHRGEPHTTVSEQGQWNFRGGISTPTLFLGDGSSLKVANGHLVWVGMEGTPHQLDR